MPRPAALLALALAVVLAGCTVTIGGVDTTPGDSTGADGAPAGTDDGVTATVTNVVDGDTVDVRFADNSTDRIRLLGVDVPETYGENSPAEFEGVPETAAGRECLGEAGDYVAREVRAELAGARVTVTTDPAADRRGGYGRLLAYLSHDGREINHWLVDRGYARVYDSTFSRADRFYAAEADAQSAGRGLWTCRDGTPDPAWATATPAALSGPAALPRSVALPGPAALP